MKKKIIVVTGASSGFGALSARAFALAGHTVFASMRETTGRNVSQVEAVAQFAQENAADLRAVEMDVQSDFSVKTGVEEVLALTGRIDVVVHNAGHMAFGPAEAFTTEQFAQLYDINVLSTQRVNREVLPHMRERRNGLLLWVSSSSARGGTPPFLSPYFAAKAAMDSLAVSYASELTRWGIETSIVVPGAFTRGTNHFAHAGAPSDAARAAEYERGPYAGVAATALEGLNALEPPDADAADVARAMVEIVNAPYGTRPFRVHIDPSQDGAEVVNGVADRVRRELFRNIGLSDLLVVDGTR
ncbi:SDR family oxidoreductase [Paraburkholderia phytofirmans]|uniref:SDR family oxidoreductase n=1 Tax=Paraburkholderia phytofirmans TaxID=261302 RepID=UPI0038B929FA